MNADEFTREMLRRSVAQVCLAQDIKGSESRALDVLTDFTQHYIETLGKHMHRYCELAGRSECDLQDVAAALHHDMGDLGASSLPDLTRAAVQIVEASHEDEDDSDKKKAPASVVYDVPEYPMERAVSMGASAPVGEVVRPAHVPDFLPAFPSTFTYKRSDMPAAARDEDKRGRQVEQLRQAKNALTHLESVQQDDDEL